MICIGVSSFAIPSLPQILTSMSSVVGEDSCTLNHGGELKVQQELVGPHPCPSHKGSPSGRRANSPWCWELNLPHRSSFDLQMREYGRQQCSQWHRGMSKQEQLRQNHHRSSRCVGEGNRASHLLHQYRKNQLTDLHQWIMQLWVYSESQ